jgi:hypothetical protein
MHTELAVGQLIKDDFFTLFESVGAIEVCNPGLMGNYAALLAFKLCLRF